MEYVKICGVYYAIVNVTKDLQSCKKKFLIVTKFLHSAQNMPNCFFRNYYYSTFKH